MAQISWTPQAADDLEAISNFISQDSIHYANLFVIDVLTAIERLQPFPMLGPTVPEAGNPAIS